MSRISVRAGAPQAVSATAEDQKVITAQGGAVAYANTDGSGSLSAGSSVTVSSDTTLTVSSGRAYAFVADVAGPLDTLTEASLPAAVATKRRRYVNAYEYGGRFADDGVHTVLNTLFTDANYVGWDIYLPEPVSDHEVTGRIRWQSELAGHTRAPRIVGDDNTVLTVAESFQTGVVLSVEGRTLSSTTLASDVAAGAVQITLDSALSGLARGDLLRLTSTQTLGEPYKDSAVKGETVEVASVSGVTVTLMEPLHFAYEADDYTVTVRRVESPTGGGIELAVDNPYQPAWADIVADNGDQSLVYRLACRGFRDNLTLSRGNSRGLELLHCYDFDARVVVRDLMDKDEPFASYGYGVNVSGACRHSRFERITAARCRHAFTTTNGYEIPLHTSIDVLHATQMTSAAFDTHQEGDGVHVGRAVIKDTLSTGAQIRGANTTIDELIIDGVGLENDAGHGGTGLWVQKGASLTAGRVVLKNVTGGDYRPLAGDETPSVVTGHALRIDSTATDALPGKVHIDELIVDGCDGAALSLGTQSAAHGAHVPHYFGRVVSRDVGRAATAGQEYHVIQSGTDVRAWDEQTVIGELVAEGGDAVLSVEAADTLRVSKLAAAGARAVTGLRYEQVVRPTSEDAPRVLSAARGITTENFPMQAGIGQTILVGGTEYLSLLPVFAGQRIANLHVCVGTAGATMTLSKLALKDSTGAVLGVTADLTTNWESTGLKSHALGTAYVAQTTGALYVSILAAGSTLPQMLRSHTITAGAGTLNSGLRAFATGGTGLSDIPNPSTLSATGAICFWVGAS